LLIGKFKNKYGASGSLAKYIENEVTKFLASDRLTEANLKNLDAKIAAEADKKERQS
jgi:cation transport regulator ChaC